MAEPSERTIMRSAFSSSLLAVAAAGLLAACGQETSAAPAKPAASGPQPIAGASAAHPVVVELFQSQGCSSCPPANSNVNALADRSEVLALSFAVTYWDQLGWQDRFAKPAYTARQWDYAHHAGRSQVATPQVIVNGDTAIVGSNRQQLDRTIRAAGPARGGPSLAVEGLTLRVGGGKAAAPSTVWLVRYEPRSIPVAIRAGENGGRTLPHRDIVRELVKLDAWTGAAKTVVLPAATRPGLASAILVQEGVGGRITAALKV
ncbi:DUF1223 domain-containing protein [Sphingomonas sp.]|uniref:DUF1223 domain-containing protein n=1 Tax=Sphingomonas sp. TaxID=28214 RepID=UPI0035C82868